MSYYHDIPPARKEDLDPDQTLLCGSSLKGFSPLPIKLPFAPIYAIDWHANKTSSSISAVQWLSPEGKGKIESKNWQDVAIRSRRVAQYVLDQIGIDEQQAWQERFHGFKEELTPRVVAIVAHVDPWRYRLLGE